MDDHMTSAPARLAKLGCAPFLDHLDRGLIESGGLRRLITDDRLSGVTTNPVIFGKAITEGREYDADLGRMTAAGTRGDELFLRLMVDDVRAAADEFAPLYRQSNRRLGYVSLEVLPELARDVPGTVSMAHDLWARVGRPNVLIKVPATPEGIVAVEELIASGVNVNVTTIFSAQTYEQVFWAYVRGQERRGTPDAASVASVFVARIDAVVDSAIEAGVSAGRLDRSWLDVLGAAALASVRMIYERYRHLYALPETRRIVERGAMPQRLLWASTQSRNPAYRDVKYVEGVALPDTLVTMPLATLDAFRDHGVVDPALPTGTESAERIWTRLREIGVTPEAVADALLETVLGVFSQAIVDLRRVVVAKAAEASVGA